MLRLAALTLAAVLVVSVAVSEAAFRTPMAPAQRLLPASQTPTVFMKDVHLEGGRTATLPIIVEGLTDGLSGYTLSVSSPNASVEIITARSRALRSPLSTISTSTSQADISGVDLFNAVGASQRAVELATVQILGISAGEAVLALTVSQMDDDAGFAMPPNVISAPAPLQWDTEPELIEALLRALDAAVAGLMATKEGEPAERRRPTLIAVMPRGPTAHARKVRCSRSR